MFDTAWDVCAVIPCLNGGTCVDFQTFGFCLCPPGYSGVICQIGKFLIHCKKQWEDTCDEGAVSVMFEFMKLFGLN